MKNNILKIFCVFIFTVFSLHIFALNLSVFELNYENLDKTYGFFLAIWSSMNHFDISWIILGIFIYDFYYHQYFIEGNWKINKLIVIILSAIFSILILLKTSYDLYKDFRIIYISFAQFYKSLMVGIGYYFFIYAILKKILFISNKQKEMSLNEKD